MLFKIFLGASILIFLSGKIEDDWTIKKITVVGIAKDSKGAAIVVTDTYHYIIDRLDAWSNKYLGKKVKVTGTLVTEEHKKQSTDSILVQERIGTWHILKKAKWSLVN